MTVDHKSLLQTNISVLLGVLMTLPFLYAAALMVRYECVCTADHQRVQEARNWPSVPGTVEDYHEQSYSHTVRTHPLRNTYSALVSYWYQVDGVSLVAQQGNFMEYPHDNKLLVLSLWGGTNHVFAYNEDISNRLKLKYSVGTKLPVKYNPANPSESFIDVEDSVDYDSWFRRFLLCCVVACFLLLLRNFLKSVQARRASE